MRDIYFSLKQENNILRENAEHNDKVVDKVNWGNQLLKKENEQLKSILTKLSEWLKETRINSAFIDEQTIMEVQLKIQELEQGSD